MHQTTQQYEFSSNTGHPGASAFHMTREFGSEPQQNTTYEYSRSVGHPGQPLEHAHSATNITKTYEFSGVPNFGGSSNQGTTTYEYTRTVGHPSQISYEFPKSSQAPERHSAYETRVYTQTYGGEQVVKSRPSPAKQQEPQSETSSERDPDTIDFNHDELVDLMAEEHRHIRGTEPVIITTTKDYTPITTNYATDLKYSTADLLNFPTTGTTVTTYTVEKEKKSSAPVNVDVEVVGSTHHVEPIVTTSTTQYHHIEPVVTTQYHHGVEEWSKKKYLNSLADHEEEVEETRLDYCGLCVSKRRLKKSKY